MKLKIKTDCGFYETEIPEELEAEELSAFIEKLKEIQRFLEPQRKYNVDKSDKQPAEKGKYSYANWTREQALAYYKVYYFGTEEEKAKLEKKEGLSYELRRRFAIQPQEVGLQRFPRRGEFGGRANNSNLKEFVEKYKL